MSGVTNVGTHRYPAFPTTPAVQACGSRGVMEGRLCGLIDRGPKELQGCRVQAAYRIRVKPTANGLPAQSVLGTLEGLVICGC